MQGSRPLDSSHHRSRRCHCVTRPFPRSGCISHPFNVSPASAQTPSLRFSLRGTTVRGVAPAVSRRGCTVGGRQLLCPGGENDSKVAAGVRSRPEGNPGPQRSDSGPCSVAAPVAAEPDLSLSSRTRTGLRGPRGHCGDGTGAGGECPGSALQTSALETSGTCWSAHTRTKQDGNAPHLPTLVPKILLSLHTRKPRLRGRDAELGSSELRRGRRSARPPLWPPARAPALGPAAPRRELRALSFPGIGSANT